MFEKFGVSNWSFWIACLAGSAVVFYVITKRGKCEKQECKKQECEKQEVETDWKTERDEIRRQNIRPLFTDNSESKSLKETKPNTSWSADAHYRMLMSIPSRGKRKVVKSKLQPASKLSPTGTESQGSTSACESYSGYNNNDAYVNSTYGTLMAAALVKKCSDACHEGANNEDIHHVDAHHQDVSETSYDTNNE